MGGVVIDDEDRFIRHKEPAGIAVEVGIEGQGKTVFTGGPRVATVSAPGLALYPVRRHPAHDGAVRQHTRAMRLQRCEGRLVRQLPALAAIRRIQYGRIQATQQHQAAVGQQGERGLVQRLSVVALNAAQQPPRTSPVVTAVNGPVQGAATVRRVGRKEDGSVGEFLGMSVGPLVVGIGHLEPQRLGPGVAIILGTHDADARVDRQVPRRRLCQSVPGGLLVDE